MIYRLVLAGMAFAVATTMGAYAQEIETHELGSEVLGETRHIYVSLPSNYQESDEAYPTIVVLDGEFHTRHMREAVNSRYQMGYPNAIVVGIKNVDRGRDFTFEPSDEAPTGGGADRFLDHIENELVPYLDDNFRTTGHVSLFGHSGGGLFAAYSIIHAPDLFSGYIVVSPTLRWGSFGLVEPLRTALANQESVVRIHLSWGSETGDEYQGFLRFQEALERASGAVIYDVAPDTTEDHNSIPYIAAFKGLKTLYGPFQLPADKEGAPLDDIRAYYRDVGEEYGVDGRPPQRLLLLRGSEERMEGEASASIETFKVFVELYPGNPLPLIQLAESYVAAGRLEDALATYRQSAAIVAWPPDLDERIATLEERLAQRQ